MKLMYSVQYASLSVNNIMLKFVISFLYLESTITWYVFMNSNLSDKAKAILSSGVDSIEIFTDGSYNGRDGSGGWAAVFCVKRTQQSPVEYHVIGGGESASSEIKNDITKMEMRAILEALNEVKSIAKNMPEAIKIVTDSLTVVELIQNHQNGKASKKPTNKELKASIFANIDDLKQNIDVQLEWVKSHSGVKGNELADVIANRERKSIHARR